ncbi:transposase [Algibacter sp. Ld11]|uniref:transposase n=1 Tax=Algibacter sp. Ld11 TaxID=649150 RepID=UPI003866CE17
MQASRDRNSSFNPLIVKKRESTTEDIENIIISLYTKGMSNSDIEEQMRELYDFKISTSIISRIIDKITGDVIALRKDLWKPPSLLFGWIY